jgi:hypothetical protein
MASIQKILGSLLMSMGLALLACSLVLVPTSNLLADGGSGGDTILGGCSGDSVCNNGCTIQVTCPGTVGNKCHQDDPPDPNNPCDGCSCSYNINGDCHCLPSVGT